MTKLSKRQRELLSSNLGFIIYTDELTALDSYQGRCCCTPSSLKINVENSLQLASVFLSGKSHKYLYKLNISSANKIPVFNNFKLIEYNLYEHSTYINKSRLCRFLLRPEVFNYWFDEKMCEEALQYYVTLFYFRFFKKILYSLW